MELPELSTVLSVLAYYLIHSWGYSHQGLGSLVTPFYRGENCTGQPCDPACRALHQCTPAGAVTGHLPGSRTGPLSSAEPDRPGGITALGSGGQSSSWLVTPRPEDSLCRGAQAYPPPTPPHTHTHTRAHTHTHTHAHIGTSPASPSLLPASASCSLTLLTWQKALPGWGSRPLPSPTSPPGHVHCPAVCPAHVDSGPASSYPQGPRITATHSPAHLSSFTALLCLRGGKKGQRRVHLGQRSPVSPPQLCGVVPERLLVVARVNLSMHPPAPPPHPLALGRLGAGW